MSGTLGKNGDPGLVSLDLASFIIVTAEVVSWQPTKIASCLHREGPKYQACATWG